MVRVGRLAVSLATIASVALAAHTAWNLRQVRRPRTDSPAVAERVDILIPARDEEAHLATTLACAREQSGVDRLGILVLDDDSSDATGAIAESAAARDARVVALRGTQSPPAGWIGKPWACMRLAQASKADVLVFVDADVVLEPHAVRALVDLLRGNALDMVAPYPRQVAGSPLERLVQPLVTWAWSATVPVRAAERSTRTSLAAANGQLLAVDARAYREVGGHAAVAGEVIEDVALMRAFKRNGFACATVDGSDLATCRMYDSASALADGYAKSLWSAFGSPAGCAAACAGLAFVYVLPALAAAGARRADTRAIGVIGYAAAVASRAMVSRRTGERTWPDSLAHPASITAFIALTGLSWRRHLRGATQWKGRAVVAAPHGTAPRP